MMQNKLCAFPNIHYEEEPLAKVIVHYILQGQADESIALVKKMSLQSRSESELMPQCGYQLRNGLTSSDLYTKLSSMPDSRLRDQLCFYSVVGRVDASEVIKIILLIKDPSNRVIAQNNYPSAIGELFELGLARHGHISEAISCLKNASQNTYDRVLTVLLELEKYEDAEQLITAFPSEGNYHPMHLAKVLSHYILQGQAQKSLALLDKMQLNLKNGQHLLGLCAQNCTQKRDLYRNLSTIPSGDFRDQLCIQVLSVLSAYSREPMEAKEILLLIDNPKEKIVGERYYSYIDRAWKPTNQAKVEIVITPSEKVPKEIKPPMPKPSLIELSRTERGKRLLANLWQQNVWYRVLSCLTLGVLPLLTFLFGCTFLSSKSKWVKNT